MNRYHLTGAVRYLLFCPKAPDTDLCDPPASCPGHSYHSPVDVYLDAPDVQRATLAALAKVKTAYPWPLWDGEPAIEQIDAPAARTGRPVENGPPLPGMETFLTRRGGIH